jgi:hypothetical protein
MNKTERDRLEAERDNQGLRVFYQAVADDGEDWSGYFSKYEAALAWGRGQLVEGKWTRFTVDKVYFPPSNKARPQSYIPSEAVKR